MRQNEVLDVSGHLTIVKVFKDGTEEVVYDDHNVITSGMGVGLSLLFAGQGSSVEDYQIRYFQVGSGALAGDPDYTKYKLESPIETASYYGGAATSTHKRMQPDGTASTDAELFAYIPDNIIKKSSPTSVTYFLYLTEEAEIPESIDEIGLFMNNPTATLVADKRSPLVAYRKFTEIEKTNSFSLVFKWKLSF
jgi:hypothetical protein